MIVKICFYNGDVLRIKLDLNRPILDQINYSNHNCVYLYNGSSINETDNVKSLGLKSGEYIDAIEVR
jgi:hypothetical protein